MTAVSPSSLSLTEALRGSVARLQGDLAKKQTEATTGKLADAGLALGDRRGQINALAEQGQSLQTIIDTNALVTQRLDASQAAISDITAGAQNFLSALVANASGNADPSIIQAQAKSALGSFTGTINTSVNGEYIFAGINTANSPIAEYPGTPPGPAKLAVDAAFQSTFGFAATDPAAAAITPAAFQSFLDNQFSTLFDSTNFAATFSSAADAPVESRVSPSRTIQTSASANASAFRDLVKGYVAVSEFAATKISTDAFKIVIDHATSSTGKAISGLSTTAATLGTAQTDVSDSSNRLKFQQDLLTKALGSLQDVDSYAVSIRISALTTQIETAYSLTSRLQQLSLLKYI